MFGVWAAGAVHVPLNPRLADDEIERAARRRRTGRRGHHR